jgi:hypothetical protein
MSLAIKYRNPRRPGEAGLVIVCEPALVEETKASLVRRGFTIVEVTPLGRWSLLA